MPSTDGALGWAAVTTLDEEFLRIVSQPTPDPRPVYARMREEAPVFRTPLGFWYVTRYDLAQQVIRIFPLPNCEPDADGERWDTRAAEHTRESASDAFRDGMGVGRRAVGQQDNELLTAVAGRNIAGADAVAKDPGEQT